jgi:putative heme transporter
MIRARLRRSTVDEGVKAAEFVEVDPAALTGLFTTPHWLRDLGLTAWLLVGVTLLLVGLVWLLALTHTIVMPVITAGVVAAVASP